MTSRKKSKHYEVMVGMVDDNVERLKVIGRREINMNAKMKKMFYESDRRRFKPYFNDAKELFGFAFLIHLRELVDNKQK